MPDETLAKATIAAALIQSGQFPSLHSDAIGNADFDWREGPAFLALRKLTDAIYASLHEPLEKPIDARASLGISV